MAKFLLHLLALVLLTLIAAAKELTMDILDPTQGLDLVHFEVDVASRRGQDLISSLVNDPNQISLDSYFAEVESTNVANTVLRTSKVNSSSNVS